MPPGWDVRSQVSARFRDRLLGDPLGWHTSPTKGSEAFADVLTPTTHDDQVADACDALFPLAAVPMSKWYRRGATRPGSKVSAWE